MTPAIGTEAICPAMDVDTIDKWQEAIDGVALDIVRHFDREHTKRDHEAMLRAVKVRLSDIAADLWAAGHHWDESQRRWDPPTRYMRDNEKARAALGAAQPGERDFQP